MGAEAGTRHMLCFSVLDRVRLRQRAIHLKEEGPRLREVGMIEVDFVGLRTFLIVCEKQSLTEAARVLGTTQSAVSQRLKKLEDQTRFRLLDRQLRPIGPTAAGQVLLERARRILAEVGQLEFDLAGRADILIRELRLGIADSLGSALVPSLVEAIRPSVTQLIVRVDGSADLGRLLIERELHAIISSDPLEDRDDVDRWEIYTEPMVLILPAGVPQGAGRSVESLRQLATSLPFIRYSPVSPLARQIEMHLRRLGLQPPRNLEFNESETIVEMVAHGLGWAITTPLCLLQARAVPSPVGVLKLPAGEISRAFTLLCRHDELGFLPRQLFQLSCTIIEERVIRRIGTEWPWLASRLSVASPPASFRPVGGNLKAVRSSNADYQTVRGHSLRIAIGELS
jgi:DNA-binding transcriptional LysR family regulator